jgi:hypothetical protein
MKKLKQLFCRHNWKWTNPRHFISLNADEPIKNVLKCTKCGLVKMPTEERK